MLTFVQGITLIHTLSIFEFYSMRNDKKNLIVDLTLQFSLGIISFCDELQLLKKYVVANQLLKSGTSIGANVREAQNAESKRDFVHKLKIALKEADETDYWLTLCRLSKNYPMNYNLLEEVESINKILSKIISTTKNSISK